MIYSRNIQNRIAKVTLLLSLFCFLFTATSAAQETHFGVKAGFNYSSVVGDLTDGVKFRFSGHGGVFVEMELAYNFALQTELLYSSQGFQISSDLLALETDGVVTDDNDFRTNVQLNYLTIPMLGKFSLNDRLDVEFGPQFGFLLNQVSKTKNLDEIDDTAPDNRTSVSGDFQLDYGVIVGLSFHVVDKLSIAPRFYVGIRNRLNGLDSILQNYNVALQISANYSFF